MNRFIMAAAASIVATGAAYAEVTEDDLESTVKCGAVEFWD